MDENNKDNKEKDKDREKEKDKDKDGSVDKEQSGTIAASSSGTSGGADTPSAEEEQALRKVNFECYSTPLAILTYKIKATLRG
jgi:hypothetical protein